MQTSNGYNIFEKIIFVYHLQKSKTVQHFEKGSQNLFEKIERFSRKFCIPPTQKLVIIQVIAVMTRVIPISFVKVHSKFSLHMRTAVIELGTSSIASTIVPAAPLLNYKKFKINHYSLENLENTNFKRR